MASGSLPMAASVWLGWPRPQALADETAIRVSFCGDNTPEDVDAFLDRFEDGMKHLQKIRK